MNKELHDKIDYLLNKYKTNNFMKEKLHSHILDNLENILDQIYNTNQIKIQHQEYLESEKKKFKNLFFSKYNFFYCNNNDKFYDYNGSYNIINEDLIYYETLQNIPCNHSLYKYRHKIINFIIKSIKNDRNLFNSIPESCTIQHAINYLYPTIFSNKESAKYFLTILGDIILKKNINLIYFLPNHSKDFIKILNDCFKILFNINILSQFKYKYQNHEFKLCRLLNLNNVNINIYYEIHNHTTYIIHTAIHYSMRFKNSERFLNENLTSNVKDYINFLKDTTLDSILNEFTNTFIICKNKSINDRNMQFLWKNFLKNKNLPIICNNKFLKENLLCKLKYDENTNKYLNITNKAFPYVSQFEDFCNKYILITTNVNIEYEINEITKLFYKINKHLLSEDNLLELIKYFIPNINIRNNKYISNIDCLLWDKNKEIIDTFHKYKELNNNIVNSYDAYNYYCKENENYMICSKDYFNKTIANLI